MKDQLNSIAFPAPGPLLPKSSGHAEIDFLSAAQQKALDELTALVKLGLCKASYGGFRIRTAPLIFGESGSGKTAVMRRLAQELGDEGVPYPLLQLSAPGWVIHAAKAQPSSLSLVRAFVNRHHERGGLIHLDEIDKSVPLGSAAWSETWCVSLIGEMLALIDAVTLGGDDSRLLGAGWTHEDIARLSGGGFTLIGSGTWQRAAEKAHNDGSSHREIMEEEMILPPELTRRFSSRHVEITLPDKQDFVAALAGLYQELGLSTRESMLDVVSDAAVSSGLGFRFVECHLTDLLLRYPRLQRPAQKADVRPVRNIISQAASDELKRNVFTLFASLEQVVAELRLQVRLNASHFCDGDSKSLRENIITTASFDQGCLDLLAGIQFHYTTNEASRHQLHETFWRSVHTVGFFVSQRLDNDLSWLAAQDLMELFGSCQLRVSQVIPAWQHFCSFDCPETG